MQEEKKGNPFMGYLEALDRAIYIHILLFLIEERKTAAAERFLLRQLFSKRSDSFLTLEFLYFY